LAIMSGSSVTKPYVKATTPVLASLIIDANNRSIPTYFEVETHTVTHIRWLGFKEPSPCAGVIFLQIEIIPTLHSPVVDFEGYAKEIREVATAYPSLKEIEISYGRGGFVRRHAVQQRVEEHLSKDGINPKLTWSKEGCKADLPGNATMIVSSSPTLLSSPC
jgi:hypothetical protein